MGLIESIMAMIFGGGRNVVAETVEVFRENSEKGAVREAGQRGAALAQFAAEFGQTRTSGFDRRLPRPLLALGTIALFVSAMVDPVWFSQRMAGIALVPEPLWWLMGAIVSFYFGARYQLKGQEFQRQTLQAVAAVAPPAASLGDFDNNAALQDWQAQYGRS
uniref:holin family protein n=1 Tax=Yoonia sp. TaxID=2212373 RepID=UPI0040486AF8